MPFYFRDFLKSERVLSMPRGDRMLYLELLCRQWEHGPLPDDADLCGRLIGASGSGDADAILHILSQFFDLVDGRRVNARCAELRQAAIARTEAASKSGKASAAARASKPMSNERSTNVERPLNDRSTLRGEERREEEKTRTPSSTKGHRGKRDVLFQEAEEAPTQAAKANGRARSSAEKLWLEAWKATRQEDYALLRADCIVLNKLGSDFGLDALSMKIQGILADTDKFVSSNASPRLLESRWNQVGSFPIPGRKPPTSPDRLAKLKAILDKGEPKRGTEAWCDWDSARQEIASVKVNGS